jgi:hypothetical protein
MSQQCHDFLACSSQLSEESEEDLNGPISSSAANELLTSNDANSAPGLAKGTKGDSQSEGSEDEQMALELVADLLRYANALRFDAQS